MRKLLNYLVFIKNFGGIANDIYYSKRRIKNEKDI